MTLFTEHLKFGCISCINGHRTNQCQHVGKVNENGLMVLIKDRGRPKKFKGIFGDATVTLISACISSKNKRCPIDGKFSYLCESRCCNTYKLGVELDPDSLIMKVQTNDSIKIIDGRDLNHEALPKSAVNPDRKYEAGNCSGNGVSFFNSKKSNHLEVNNKTPKRITKPIRRRRRSSFETQRTNISNSTNIWSSSSTKKKPNHLEELLQMREEDEKVPSFSLSTDTLSDTTTERTTPEENLITLFNSNYHIKDLQEDDQPISFGSLDITQDSFKQKPMADDTVNCYEDEPDYNDDNSYNNDYIEQYLDFNDLDNFVGNFKEDKNLENSSLTNTDISNLFTDIFDPSEFLNFEEPNSTEEQDEFIPNDSKSIDEIVKEDCSKDYSIEIPSKPMDQDSIFSLIESIYALVSQDI